MRINLAPAAEASLFSPVNVGSLRLANRIVMAPMTRSRADADRLPSPLAPTYYGQRASAGLIITEATQISAEAAGYPRIPGIYNEAQVTSWRAVVDAVHARGGKVVLQLWHAGRVSHPLSLNGRVPVAPSAIAPAGEIFTTLGRRPFVVPRALETVEIRKLVGEFAEAGRRARDAGFDGVDIHAANGYLIDQFLRDGSNRRTDRYGGSPANRARLLREVTEAVCGVVGADRVGIRLSPFHTANDMRDSDPNATFTHAARVLEGIGVAYLHVVEPSPGHPKATSEGQALITRPGHLLRRWPGGLCRLSGLRHQPCGHRLLPACAPVESNPGNLARELKPCLPLERLVQAALRIPVERSGIQKPEGLSRPDGLSDDLEGRIR